MSRWQCAVCGTELVYPLVKLFDEVAGRCDACGGARRMIPFEGADE